MILAGTEETNSKRLFFKHNPVLCVCVILWVFCFLFMNTICVASLPVAELRRELPSDLRLCWSTLWFHNRTVRLSCWEERTLMSQILEWSLCSAVPWRQTNYALSHERNTREADCCRLRHCEPASSVHRTTMALLPSVGPIKNLNISTFWPKIFSSSSVFWNLQRIDCSFNSERYLMFPRLPWRTLGIEMSVVLF